LICTEPRSGSWLLVEAIQATGVAGRPEEYFRPDWFQRFQRSGALEYQHRLHRCDPWPDGSVPDRGEPENDDPATYRAFLDAVMALGATENGVFAAKIHRNQLDRAVGLSAGGAVNGADDRSLATWFPNPRFVYLHRADAIRRAVSHYRAIQTDVWWRDGGEPREPTTPHRSLPAFDEIERLRLLAARHDRAWRTLFRRIGVRPLELVYEDVCADLEGSVRRVLEHIGIDSSAVTQLPAPRLTRQADEWTDRTVHEYITWRRATSDIPEAFYGPNLEW
jgi:LPS sulfotransferase NodH